MDEIRSKALKDITTERDRQERLAHGGDTEAFDRTCSEQDWVAFVVAYAGRASGKVFRNVAEGQSFRNNMVKAAALALAAIEAHDRGYLEKK